MDLRINIKHSPHQTVNSAGRELASFSKPPVPDLMWEVFQGASLVAMLSGMAEIWQ